MHWLLLLAMIPATTVMLPACLAGDDVSEPVKTDLLEAGREDYKPNAALVQRIMMAADKNRDGKLSLEEYKLLDVQARHHGEEHFETGDANHDEFIDADELAGALRKQTWFAILSEGTEPCFTRLDVNNDGKADVFVGDRNNAAGSGEAFVVFGADVPTDIDVSTPGAGWVSVSGAATGGLGSSAGAGDLNADGVADLVLGASGGPTAPGSVYVVFGPVASDVDLSALGTGGFAISGGGHQ